jgi:hypothetical protein
VSATQLIGEIALRVLRISLLIVLGVYLANVAVDRGVIETIARGSRWLTRPAHLPDEVGTAIVTTAASTTAGYGMLAEFRTQGRLSDRETVIAVIMNTFFGFIQHIFTFYAPVLIPILGLQVGLLYVSFRAAIALSITVCGVVLGAILLGVPGRSDADTTAPSPVGPQGTARERTLRTVRRIIPRLAVVYGVVTYLVEVYDLTAIGAVGAPLVASVDLPTAAVGVIAIFTLDTTAGAATIAPLIGSVFTPQTAVATLLIGGIVSFTVSTFKRSIPFQVGVWGPEFGVKIVLVNTVFKIIFISIAVAALLSV